MTDVGETPDAHAFQTLTRTEAILLLRYIPAKYLLGRVRPAFMATYVLLVVSVALMVAFGRPLWASGVLVVLVGVAVILHMATTSTIRRMGALRQLEAFDSHVDDIVDSWWPTFREQMRRVGGVGSAWGLLKLSARAAMRRQSLDDALFDTVDWDALIPVERCARARAALAEAAGPD
jgi:hypothetical protein